MEFNKDIIEELELKEIPINFILKATNKSPPGIKNYRKFLDKERDYLSYRKTVSNEQDNYLKYEINKNVSNLSEDVKVNNSYSNINFKNKNINNSRKNMKKNIPRFQLPIDKKIEKIVYFNNEDVSKKDYINNNFNQLDDQDIYLTLKNDKNRYFNEDNISESIHKNSDIDIITTENKNIIDNRNLNMIQDNYMFKDEIEYNKIFSDRNESFVDDYNSHEFNVETINNFEYIDGNENLLNNNNNIQNNNNANYNDINHNNTNYNNTNHNNTNHINHDNIQNNNININNYYNYKDEEFDNKQVFNDNLEYIKNINKYIPISISSSNNNREIKIENINNRNRYEQLFKSEEEFNNIFNKFWLEAADELREKKINDDIENENINPVPFQSDLLYTNKKRKIKTTIPFDQIKKKNHVNNPINPIGLLKSLKNQNNDYYDKVSYNEEISTRASTMNNITNGSIELISNNNTIETYRSFNNLSSFLNQNKKISNYDNKIEEIESETFISNNQNYLKMNKFENFLMIQDPNRNLENEKSIQQLRDYIENNNHRISKSKISFSDEDIKKDIYRNTNIHDLSESDNNYKNDYSINNDNIIQDDNIIDDTIHNIEINIENYDCGFSIDNKDFDENHEIYKNDKNNKNNKSNENDENNKNDKNDIEVNSVKSLTISAKNSSSTLSSYLNTKINHINIKNNKTIIYNSLTLIQDFLLTFQNFNLNKIFSQIEIQEKIKTKNNINYFSTWSNSIKTYENLILFSERRNIILIIMIILNIILISISNIIIPIIYDIKNLFTILILHPIMNFIIFYILNGCLFHIFINKIYRFYKSILNNYILFLTELNKIRRKNFHKNYHEEDDIIEQIFNQLLLDYISYIREFENNATIKYKKSLLTYFFIGIIQTSLTLIMNIFIININQRKPLLFNIINIINIMLIMSLYLTMTINNNHKYIKWNLKDAFDNDVILKIDKNIQNQHLKFLTFVTSIIEFILYKNYSLNSLSNYKNTISNISLHEMEQHKILNKVHINHLNLNIICRIHFQVDEKYDYLFKQFQYNDLWPFFYLKYDKKDKNLIISSDNILTIIQKIPINLISIESIQSSIFPWLLIYDYQNIQNYQLIENLKNYFFNQDTFNEKQIENNFVKHLDELIENYNFIMFEDFTENEQFNSEDESDISIKGIKNQQIYIMNCNIPKEVFNNFLKESVINYEYQLIKFQIVCFSFNDLLDIYRIIN